MTRKNNYILLTILPFFLLSACVGGSKSKKDPLISRAYHDLTARDNGYFNAKLLLEQSRESLWENQLEDFSATLPVYKFGDKESAQGEQPNLDEVIKKSSIAIQLHEKSKWVDDCYLLIGQANFYKKDYDEALTSFQYVVSKYSDGTRKKKKKKKKKDPSWLYTNLAHLPVANEAAVWTVLTLIEKKDYAEAKTALSVIKGNPKFPEKLLGMLYATEAHLYLRQKQAEPAIKSLNLAIENTKNKKEKARYSFILAQLYEATGKFQLSMDSYASVIKLKPDYVTDFYAKLYLATQGMKNFGLSSDNTTGILRDMLKEDKYKEFFPLIYNTLADIELANSQVDAAIDYLQLGIKNGDVNLEEKALSYVRLGDIYYDRTEFKPAYNQYDSALLSLNRNYFRYAEVSARRDGLIELVKSINTIETEERLQYLASLNEFELEKELDKMIQEQEAAAQQEFLDGGKEVEEVRTGDVGDFYFYNTTLISRGYGEFKKTWGARKLEDNWRRSDKSSFDEELAGDNPEKEPEESDIDLNSSKLTREDIINSLPTTPEELAISNNRIAGALYNAGSIYRQKFNNTPKATDYFRKNINEYPKNPFELQSLYQLYVIYDGKPGQDPYKQSILNDYPNSLFANIIRDPDYLQKQLKKNEAVEIYYTTTYDIYNAGDLATVRTRLSAADSLFPSNPLQPKYDMLAALSIVDTASIESFQIALQSIVDKYPSNEVGVKAKEILDYIKRGAKKEETEVASETVYTYKAKEEHYFIIIIPSKGKEATTIKNKLADFNTAHFNMKKFRISSLLFGADQTLVLIKTFMDASEAMEYYDFLDTEYDTVFEDINMDDSYLFLISKSNYVKLYKSKDAETYYIFFEQNYIIEE